MSRPQPGILEPVPPQARHLTFRLATGATADAVRRQLETMPTDERHVIGIGLSVVTLLGGTIPGMRAFPDLVGAGVEMPATPGALWCWLRGEDRGELLHAGRAIEQHLAGQFDLTDVTDAFRYGTGRDLTGYEDGTENPTGETATQVTCVAGRGAGLDGSSFVTVQKWVHDLRKFEAMPPDTQDATIGRRRSDNEELEDAPTSAHVKRTAQESFDPEAFLLRRSMPWGDARGEGLMFVAFGASFDPFEAQARRMVGLEDGITDALFHFTHATSGSYFWCPPMTRDRLDLQRLTA